MSFESCFWNIVFPKPLDCYMLCVFVHKCVYLHLCVLICEIIYCRSVPEALRSSILLSKPVIPHSRHKKHCGATTPRPPMHKTLLPHQSTWTVSIKKTAVIFTSTTETTRFSLPLSFSGRKTFWATQTLVHMMFTVIINFIRRCNGKDADFVHICQWGIVF